MLISAEATTPASCSAANAMTSPVAMSTRAPATVPAMRGSVSMSRNRIGLASPTKNQPGSEGDEHAARDRERREQRIVRR